MSTAELTNLAKQQLAYQRATQQLLTRQQMLEEASQSKRHMRWELFFIGILFFIISKYVLLKTQFKLVFDLFAAAKNDPVTMQCLYAWNATAWNIVLGVAYPWLNSLISESPLHQNQADFLWLAIRGNWIPTQDDLDRDFPALGLKPLAYLCGSVLATWSLKDGRSTSQLIEVVRNDAGSTPFKYFLSSAPPENRSAILDPDGNESLNELLNKGLWGIAVWMGDASPANLYAAIYTKEQPPAKCTNTQQVVGVASTAATFSMAGSALGPEGAAAGAVAGIALGFMQQKDQCGGGGGCTIQ